MQTSPVPGHFGDSDTAPLRIASPPLPEQRRAAGHGGDDPETVQLRVLAVPSEVRSPAPADTPVSAPSAVFVDRSGRRGRWLRRIGWLVGLVCGVFAIASVLTILGTNAEAPPLRDRPGPAEATASSPSAQNR